MAPQRTGIVVIMIVAFAVAKAFATDTEQVLFKHLFGNGYNKFIRPAEERHHAVTMYFSLAVTQLLNVDEKNQIITVSVWMDQSWTDYRLQWNASDFSDIESLLVPFDNVWYPDLVLDNSANGEYLLPTWKYVTVSSEGELWFTPPGKLESPCAIDVRYFPFDEQRCDLSFGPWEFNALEIRMEPKLYYVEKENYVENVEWELYNSSVVLFNDIDECCPDESFSSIVYTLVLRRRPLYYIINILIPCAAMSALTLAVFYLPSDSGEKISLSISVLIALSVFSLLVADIMPPTSDSSPLIGTFLLFNMAVNALSIIVSVVVLHLHHRSVRVYRMSPRIRKFFLRQLPPFIGLDKLACKKRGDKYKSYEGGEVALDNDFASGHRERSLEGEAVNHTPCSKRRQTGSDDRLSYFQRNVLSFLDSSSRRVRESEEEEEAIDEWKCLAAVVDRLCLIIFVVVLVLGSSAILLNAPGVAALSL